MFPEIIVLILLLLGCWWLYGIWRKALNTESGDSFPRSAGTDSKNISDQSSRPDFLQKIPKIFTQPHLMGDVGSASGEMNDAVVVRKDSNTNRTTSGANGPGQASAPANAVSKESDTASRKSNPENNQRDATTASTTSTDGGSAIAVGSQEGGFQDNLSEGAAGDRATSSIRNKPPLSGDTNQPQADLANQQSSSTPSLSNASSNSNDDREHSDRNDNKLRSHDQRTPTRQAQANALRSQSASESITAKKKPTSGNEDLRHSSESTQSKQVQTSEPKSQAAADNDAAKRELNAVTENLQKSNEKIRSLEQRINKLASSQSAADNAAGNRDEALSLRNENELKRLRAELDGQRQQNDKFSLQASDLQSRSRTDTSSGTVSPSKVQRISESQNSVSWPTASTTQPVSRTSPKSDVDSSERVRTSDGTKARKLPLFERPVETDDLKQIKGIGPVMERTLNDLGVTSFKQLSEFEESDIKKVSDALEVFPGRIERDEWVPQAGVLYREKYLVKN